MAINPATGKPYVTTQQTYDPKTGVLTVDGKAQTVPPNPAVNPAPTPAPATPSPTSQISTSDLSAPETDLVAQSQKQGTFVTYDPVTGKAVAGSRKAMEVGTQGADQYLEVPINGADPNWQDNYIVTHKSGNTLYGIKKPAPTGSNLPQNGTPGASNMGNGNQPLEGEVLPAEQPKTVLEQTQDLIDNWFANKGKAKADAMEAEGVTAIQAEMTKAQEASNKAIEMVEKMKTDLELQDILDMETQVALKEKILGTAKDKGLTMSYFNKRLSKGMEELTQDQRIARAYDIYSINTAVNAANSAQRQTQLLQGQYQMAMQNVKDTVADWTEWQGLKLDLLEQMGQLEKEDRARQETEINYQRGLAEQGYVYVESTETYNKLVKDLGVTADTFSNFFYKDPANGRIYLKPGDASMNELLSVSEATTLGVPYGTTKGEAAKMGITAPRWKGAGGGGSDTGFKFTADDRGRLLAANFTNDDIATIESDLNQHGLAAVIEGLPEDQAKAITDIAKGLTATQADEEEEPQFLSKDYFSNVFTDDQLKASAKEAGFRSMWSKWETEKNNYLDYLYGLVEQYRLAGYTDKEILKMMQ